jgi:RimJ/RimL family protein N-acetyltransferase
MNAPCLLLPAITQPVTAAEVAALGQDRGPAFYELALRYAQTHWQATLPSQALLQLNRALACVFDADTPVLSTHPLPYSVVVWLLRNCPADQFLGNPRRHWQHLATRMVEPHKALRTWRAWACWYIAKALLPADQHPADLKQIRAEGIVEPAFHSIAANLRKLSPMNDESIWLAALREAGIPIPIPIEASDLRFFELAPDQLPLVRDLAHRIWPRVYPSIISTEQIQFMLHQRYELPVLAADMRDRSARYIAIQQGIQPVGYIGIEPRPDGTLFLQKLYLLPEVAGRGIGAAALRWIEVEARSLHSNCIRLVVNKRNTNAIRAYLRAGFTFEHDLVTDIGNGFVMDDYQMVWRL